MASILLLLEALIRCCHHELVPESPRWKEEKETKDLTPIIKVKKPGKASTGLDNLDRFWSFFNDHNEETKPWKLAEYKAGLALRTRGVHFALIGPFSIITSQFSFISIMLLVINEVKY
ncbi:hypothetical protein CR513_49638, partial [Mucuna pruriens]